MTPMAPSFKPGRRGPSSAAKPSPALIDDAAGEQPVRPQLQADNGPKQRRDGLGQLQCLFVEGCQR